MIVIILLIESALVVLLAYAGHQFIFHRSRALVSACAVIMSRYQRTLRAREAKGFAVDRAWDDLTTRMLDPEWVEEEATRICDEGREKRDGSKES